MTQQYHRTIKTTRPIRSISFSDPTMTASSNLKFKYVTTQPQEPVDECTSVPTQEYEQAKALLGELIEAVEELESRRAHSLDELRQAAAEIGLLVAGRVAFEKINASDYPVDELVNRALDHVDADAKIAIHLNPQDQERLNQLFDQQEIAKLMPDVKFATDNSLAPGGCRVDAPDFGLITTVEQRLADIRELLFEGLHNAWITRRTPDENTQHLRRFPDRRRNA